MDGVRVWACEWEWASRKERKVAVRGVRRFELDLGVGGTGEPGWTEAAHAAIELTRVVVGGGVGSAWEGGGGAGRARYKAEVGLVDIISGGLCSCRVTKVEGMKHGNSKVRVETHSADEQRTRHHASLYIHVPPPSHHAKTYCREFRGYNAIVVASVSGRRPKRKVNVLSFMWLYLHTTGAYLGNNRRP